MFGLLGVLFGVFGVLFGVLGVLFGLLGFLFDGFSILVGVYLKFSSQKMYIFEFLFSE